jgi:hypothetical protein
MERAKKNGQFLQELTVFMWDLLTVKAIAEVSHI